jgi:hypothetical protein
VNLGDRNTLVPLVACLFESRGLTLYRGRGLVYVGIEELGSLWIDILVIEAKGLERGKDCWSSEVEGLGTRDLIESIELVVRHPGALTCSTVIMVGGTYLDTVEMTSDIMRPPSESDIRRGSSEFRLEMQRIPSDHRILPISSSIS